MMNKKLLTGVIRNVAVNTLDFILMCMGMMLMHVLVMHSGADCSTLLLVGIIGYVGYVVMWVVSYLNGEERGGCCCGKHEKESR